MTAELTGFCSRSTRTSFRNPLTFGTKPGSKYKLLSLNTETKIQEPASFLFFFLQRLMKEILAERLHRVTEAQQDVMSLDSIYIL